MQGQVVPEPEITAPEATDFRADIDLEPLSYIFLLSDNPETVQRYTEMFERRGMTLYHGDPTNGAVAAYEAHEGDIGAVLADADNEASLMGALHRMKEADPHLRALLVTGKREDTSRWATRGVCDIHYRPGKETEIMESLREMIEHGDGYVPRLFAAQARRENSDRVT
jgi:DNA-binding NtrC family response regulator